MRQARTFATASAPSAGLSGKVAPTALRVAVSNAPPVTTSTTATLASGATHLRAAKRAPAQSTAVPSVKRAFTRTEKRVRPAKRTSKGAKSVQKDSSVKNARVISSRWPKMANVSATSRKASSNI